MRLQHVVPASSGVPDLSSEDTESLFSAVKMLSESVISGREAEDLVENQMREEAADTKRRLEAAELFIADKMGLTEDQVARLVSEKSLSLSEVEEDVRKLTTGTEQAYKEVERDLGVQPDPEKEKKFENSQDGQEKINTTEGIALAVLAVESAAVDTKMFVLPAPSPNGRRRSLREEQAAEDANVQEKAATGIPLALVSPAA
jgi:hypothetical protein